MLINNMKNIIKNSPKNVRFETTRVTNCREKKRQRDVNRSVKEAHGIEKNEKITQIIEPC